MMLTMGVNTMTKCLYAAGLMLLLWAIPVSAAIFVQCPTSTDGVNITWNAYDKLDDRNGDGILRADTLFDNGDGQGAIPEIQDALYSNQVCLHLAAGDGFVDMADGTEQYLFSFANATDPKFYNEAAPDYESVMSAFALGANFPAPTIHVREGDHVYLSLSNVGMVMRPDLPDPHTVHWHGFPNASAVFDGVPDASISIGMGATLTYYYHVVEPGTFLYHCHVEATEHMQMGMLGNLYVEAINGSGGDTLLDGTPVASFPGYAYNGSGNYGYDIDVPLQIQSFDPDFHDANLNVQPLPFAAMEDRFPMLNGRGYPDSADASADLSAIHPTNGDKSTMSSRIVANVGERILLRISSLSTTSFHTLTVLGLPMEVIGVGSRAVPEPYYTQSVNIGGGESIDVLIDTSTATAGTYYLYTTNLEHLANHGEDYGGMMTEIELN